MRLARFLLPSFLLLCAFGAQAARPYDPDADAPLAVQAALDSAKSSQRPVLILFGANWCEDCRVLDTTLHDADNAALMAREFVLVKVDVGNFDRNMPLAMRYGNPIAGGIPAAVVLAPDGRVVYTTQAGELADARRMSATGVQDFFRSLAERVRQAPAGSPEAAPAPAN